MEKLHYVSTRNKKNALSSCEAIVSGISKDGGLFVPTHIPKVNNDFNELCKLSYKDLAFYIMKKFFTDFEDKELQNCINKAYDSKFDFKEIAPISIHNNIGFLELYHGATLAFKDMALSILPHLLTTASKKLSLDKEIVILTATSGDTGKAALAGFQDVDKIKIIVFYPKNGVSEIQKRQMITQNGSNTYVINIEGNFDDAQNGVKEIFNDKKFNELLNENNYTFSSANSINIGRLIPQIVYYFSAYFQMYNKNQINLGEKINVVVPTGNFGNILATYYAKEMGLPVNKLICASNKNNVLFDFINTGVYDKRRKFYVTMSPSMDILVSSNLERLLYHISDENDKLVSEMMNALSKDGIYCITDSMKEKLVDFYGGYASEEKTKIAINELYTNYDYLVDTHTAVAYSVYQDYLKETHDKTKTIIASTASPFKFTRSVLESIKINCTNMNDFELINIMSDKCELTIPKNIKNIETKTITQNLSCTKDSMRQVIKNILNIRG